MLNSILFKNADEKIIHTIKKIQDAIKGTDYEGKVFLVGGCIRDLMLEQPIKDLDIVVSLENGGVKLANKLAIKFGCFKLNKNPIFFPNSHAMRFQFLDDDICKDIILEFTNSRKYHYNGEKETFGTIEEDSKVRDLTINSLYYNISEAKLIDYNCGIQDLTKQILRTPTNPSMTFMDDPLRILRTIRLSSQLGWGIEKETWLAMMKNAFRIEKVAQERITSEISQILISPNPDFGIRKMYFCGLLHRIMPDIYQTTKVLSHQSNGASIFEHSLQVLKETQPIVEHRLAALFHDVGWVVGDRTANLNEFSGEVAASDLKEMKYPKAIIKSVQTAIANHGYFNASKNMACPSDKRIRKFMSICDNNMGITLDLIHANDLHQSSNKSVQILKIIQKIEKFEKEKNAQKIILPIDGNSIMGEFGLKSGPWIGQLLGKVKDAYFENPKITKDECFELVENLLHTNSIKVEY
jgi:poly(A) polymerase